MEYATIQRSVYFSLWPKSTKKDYNEHCKFVKNTNKEKLEKKEEKNEKKNKIQERELSRVDEKTICPCKKL